jgi:hypothetical protein
MARLRQVQAGLWMWDRDLGLGSGTRLVPGGAA